MPRSFVIRPFEKKEDNSGRTIDFESVHRDLIQPAIEDAGLEGSTTAEVIEPGNIREDMFSLILEADVAICDVTIHNANVFYELGIRHALRKKSTVLIRGKPSADNTPFDILTDRYLEYDLEDPASSKEALVAVLRRAMTSGKEADSPVFKLLPELTESDRSKLIVVPPDFGDDVRRAVASKSKGWLRLLAEEVRGRRFEWQALRPIAKAQWDLKDYDAAKENWELIRDMFPNDLAANLALANIYERRSRDGDKVDLIELSDAALERVLAHQNLSSASRAEALALRARNNKTRWRLEFEYLESLEERRDAAMNRALIESYLDYHEASMEDLNHYYSGIAASQMGTLISSLSDLGAFYTAFDRDKDADRFKVDLDEDLPRLRATVTTAVNRELNRLARDDENRFWAEISRADLLFLNEEESEERVLRTYRSAVPKDKPFAWDAAKGQLELFASLGFRTELVNKVIAAIEPSMVPEKGKKAKPVHVIVMGGHRIDDFSRAKPRFPADKESDARDLLREAIEKQAETDKYDVVALASAAPGTDILCHELCQDLGIQSRICLPMPESDYASSIFGELDQWRNRFLDLTRHCKVYELSEREGLPRWLSKVDTDPWERGNRWVTEMAKSWGADRVSLVALWDGLNEGDAPGGTAQLVRLARDAGTIRLKIVNTASL